MAHMQIVEWGSCFIEIFMGIFFIASALSTETIRVKKHILGAVAGAFLIWGCNQISLYSAYTTAIAIVGIAGITCVVSRLHLRDTMLFSAFYMMLLYIVDFFVLSAWGIFIGEDRIIRMIISGMTWQRVFMISVSKVLLAWISYLLSVKLFRNVSIPTRKLWIALSIFAVAVVFFLKIIFAEVTVDILWTWFFILLFFVLAVYTVVQYLWYSQDREIMNLALERNRIQLEAYSELIQTYQARQVFFHDLKNQYVILGNYLKEKKYEKAQRYIEELNLIRYKYQNRQYTGMMPLDVLLEYKRKEAERKKISVKLVTERIELPLSEQEAISLFGNAFDNAIEACEKVESNQRWIRMDIQQKGAMVFIKVANTCENKPQKQSGYLFTTKEYAELHGLGLMSMKMIVDKYNGVMDVSEKNGEYAVSISFFC